MGYNFGLRRNRMEPARLGDLPDELLVALGEKNFKLMHYDEQIIFDKINARLDKKQAEFNSKTVVK